jgi:hypothetical protein
MTSLDDVVGGGGAHGFDAEPLEMKLPKAGLANRIQRIRLRAATLR